ncbi:MAG: hypothetical protein ACO271_11715 [Burkholderiales bacterium]
MRARTLAIAAFALVSVFALAGCDGLLRGEEVARIPLPRKADGGYAPVRILLKADMSPVAFTLYADFAWGKREEHGRWNTYRVTLRGSDGTTKIGEFQVNSPELPPVESSGPPSSLVQPMLQVDIPADGEYEIEVAAVKPAEVTLEAAQLGVRMHVPRLPRI